MSKLEEFIKDRDKLLATFDKNKNMDVIAILEYVEKYHIPCPDNFNSVIGGLHKARLNVTRLTGVPDKEFKELQEKSKKWLDDIGWSYDLK